VIECLEIGYAAGGYDVEERDVGLVQFTLRSSSATMIDTTKSNTTKRHHWGPEGGCTTDVRTRTTRPVRSKSLLSLSLSLSLDIKRLWKCQWSLSLGSPTRTMREFAIKAVVGASWSFDCELVVVLLNLMCPEARR
jgi:hypothetical protein